jgi:hypothetical protein
VGAVCLRARPYRAVIVILATEQIEAIEDALQSARDQLVGDVGADALLVRELSDALRIMQAARVLTAA